MKYFLTFFYRHADQDKSLTIHTVDKSLSRFSNQPHTIGRDVQFTTSSFSSDFLSDQPLHPGQNPPVYEVVPYLLDCHHSLNDLPFLDTTYLLTTPLLEWVKHRSLYYFNLIQSILKYGTPLQKLEMAWLISVYCLIISDQLDTTLNQLQDLDTASSYSDLLFAAFCSRLDFYAYALSLLYNYMLPFNPYSFHIDPLPYFYDFHPTPEFSDILPYLHDDALDLISLFCLTEETLPESTELSQYGLEFEDWLDLTLHPYWFNFGGWEDPYLLPISHLDLCPLTTPFFLSDSVSLPPLNPDSPFTPVLGATHPHLIPSSNELLQLSRPSSRHPLCLIPTAALFSLNVRLLRAIEAFILSLMHLHCIRPHFTQFRLWAILTTADPVLEQNLLSAQAYRSQVLTDTSSSHSPDLLRLLDQLVDDAWDALIQQGGLISLTNSLSNPYFYDQRLFFPDCGPTNAFVNLTHYLLNGSYLNVKSIAWQLQSSWFPSIRTLEDNSISSHSPYYYSAPGYIARERYAFIMISRDLSDSPSDALEVRLNRANLRFHHLNSLYWPSQFTRLATYPGPSLPMVVAKNIELGVVHYQPHMPLRVFSNFPSQLPSNVTALPYELKELNSITDFTNIIDLTLNTDTTNTN